VHAFVNDLERPIGTHLFGRRMYEVLSAWETMDDPHPLMRDYAEIWRQSEKIVYSRTLETTTTARTTLEREFDPSAIAALKREAGKDLSIGGPHLAAQAIAAGLVDECHLLLSPVVVGGGNAALPTGLRWDLELADQRRFENGVVHLHYVSRSG
jgi:dihydrofolate reductase